MLKIPSKVNIAGFEIAVVLDDHVGHDEGRFGSFSQCHERIKIDSSSKPYRRSQTLLHELIEGVNNIFFLELEHRQIEQLSVGLAQALKDIEVE